MEEAEIWKPIKDFLNYEVSNKGRMRSWKGRGWYSLSLLKSMDYYKIVLWKDNRPYPRWVHRLVLEAFVGDCPKGYEAGHKDGTRGNNKLENLEWITHKDNMHQAFKMGLISRAGESNSHAKLKEGEVWLIRKLLFFGVERKTICKMFNVKLGNLSHISTKRIWPRIIYKPSIEDLRLLEEKK